VQFKDLSSRGVFKTVLIVDYLISLILFPLFYIGYFFEPESFTIHNDLSFRVAGLTIDSPLDIPGNLLLVPMALLLVFTLAIMKSATLYLLAQKTPFGKIKIDIYPNK